MGIGEDGADDKPVVFKIKGQIIALLWLCFFNFLFGFALIKMIRYEQITFSGVFGIVTLLIVFWIIGVMIMTARSDVMIDDQGISRCFLGKIWRTIRWDNITLITAFPVSDGFGKITRAYNIFPIVKPHFSFNPSGKMTFSEYMTDTPKLVELLNHYVLKYDIKIEIRETLGGKLTPASRL